MASRQKTADLERELRELRMLREELRQTLNVITSQRDFACRENSTLQDQLAIARRREAVQ
jgi:hypothetical protein